MSSRKRKSTSSSSTPAAASSDVPDHKANHGNDGEEKRSYNSQQYWDQRYQKYFQHIQSKKGDSSSSSNAASSSSSNSSKAANQKKQPQADQQEALDPSEDITDDWYYSYGDMAHILRSAFRTIDKTGRVLDLGCGISTFFEMLQAPTYETRKDENGNEVSGGGFTGDFIGLDYSPSVIAHMESRFPNVKHAKTHWICADACYLLDPNGQPPQKKQKKQQQQAASDADSGRPPALSAKNAAFFTPGSYSLIIDKATSDGMLCSNETALLTPLIYKNVAQLLAPNGVFVIASVNEAESGWFGEYVVSQLLEHGGDCQWQIEVHSPSSYKDGEEGAPNLFVIRKFVSGVSNTRNSQRTVRETTKKKREPYTIKSITY